MPQQIRLDLRRPEIGSKVRLNGALVGRERIGEWIPARLLYDHGSHVTVECEGIRYSPRKRPEFVDLCD